MNVCYLMGNIGNDPELKTTAGGTSVLKFRMATSERYKSQDGTQQEKTQWHNITIFGNRATALSKFLTKGEKILVTGRVEYSESEKEGVRRFYTDIIANELEFAGGKRNTEGATKSATSTDNSDYPESWTSSTT